MRRALAILLSALVELIHQFVAQDVMQGPPRNLLESLGETIAARVLAEFPRVTRVRVRIAKPSVAIAGSILAEAAVTIERARG